MCNCGKGVVNTVPFPGPKPAVPGTASNQNIIASNIIATPYGGIVNASINNGIRSLGANRDLLQARHGKMA
jgi:hypothetical protein